MTTKALLVPKGGISKAQKLRAALRDGGAKKNKKYPGFSLISEIAMAFDILVV